MKRILLVIFLVLAVAAAGFTGWNVLCLNRTPVPEFYTVRSNKVTEPIRIVLLTDAHQVSFGDGNEKLLKEVRALQPSIIVMAGDMINMQDPDFEFLKELSQGLVEVAPVYYGLGNHENVAVYGTDLDVKDVEKALSDYEDKEDFTPLIRWPEFFADLKEIGVHVLQNESETAQINGNTVKIGGISTNLSSFWPNSGQFIYQFATENTDCFKI